MSQITKQNFINNRTNINISNIYIYYLNKVLIFKKHMTYNPFIPMVMKFTYSMVSS